jgi:hypothetical protein
MACSCILKNVEVTLTQTERQSHTAFRTARILLMFMELNGAPGEIRTPGLLIRSQSLYPAELRAH